MKLLTLDPVIYVAMKFVWFFPLEVDFKTPQDFKNR